MKKFVKIAAIVVAVVLVIALVAPMVLRGKIAEIVKREANAMLDARLDFEKLDISLLRHFPRASLDLKGLTLVGEEPFAGDTIVAAQRISVVVNVMSLFGDEGFEVTKIILSEPALHAHKLADGRVNWDVVKASEEAQGEEETPADAEPSSFRLSVRDFRISDAAIRYEDDSTGMRFSTAPLSLRLRGDMSADQTDLDLRLTAKGMRLVSGGIPMLSGAEAELDAVIAADLANSRFTFSQNKLRLNAIEVGLDGWVELKDDAVAMDVTAGCDKVQFKDVLSLVPAFYTRDFRNLAAGGELSMALWARGEMRGAALPAFELRTKVRNGSFQYSSLPKAVDGINIDVRIANPGGALSLERLRMQLFGGSATASGSYSTAADPQRPALKLSLGLSGASSSKTFDELEMVQKLVPLFAKTGGDYSLSLDMTTALDPNMEPDLQSLSATGEIKSANIRIQNLEAFDALAKALDNDKLRKIEAKDVAVRFSIRDGRITTQPFDLKMGDIKINMSGSTGLDQTIDYTAKVALPAGSAGGILESVNVGIGGTFTSPKITLGVKEAAEQAVKNVIDQQIQKLTGSESLGEEIQKQADNLRKEAKRAGDKLVEAAEAQRTKLVDGAKEKGALAKLAAEKAGDKLVEEAKKQAGKLSAEAEKQIEKLTAKQE